MPFVVCGSITLAYIYAHLGKRVITAHINFFGIMGTNPSTSQLDYQTIFIPCAAQGWFVVRTMCIIIRPLVVFDEI